MGTAYLVAMIIGLGTVVVQLLLSGDKDFSHDVDVGHDLDVAHGADLTADGSDVEPDGGDQHHGGSPMAPLAVILSLRFWTFALMAFGMLGSFLHFFDLASFWTTLGCSLGLGFASGWLASWTFLKLSRSSPNSGAESMELVGQIGKVMLPLNTEGRAKVRLRVRGQIVDYVATSDDETLDPGSSVLVEEIRGNLVHVSPAPAGLKYSD